MLFSLFQKMRVIRYRIKLQKYTFVIKKNAINFFSPNDISFFHSQIKLSKFQFLYPHCLDCVPGFYGVCPNDCQENWIPPLCAGNKIHK